MLAAFGPSVRRDNAAPAGAAPARLPEEPASMSLPAFVRDDARRIDGGLLLTFFSAAG
jgi:hypothetical protein